MATTSRLPRGDVLVRLSTAAVTIPVLVVLTIIGGWPFDLAVVVLLGIGAQELLCAAGIRRRDPLAWLSLLTTGLLALEHDLAADLRPITLTALVMAALTLGLLRAELDQGFARWSAAVVTAVYVGVLGSFFPQVRHLPDGRDWLFVLLFTTFASDSGAFLLGRQFGRTKLAPRISPGKTRAGAIGGVAAAALAAAALNEVLGLQQAPLAMVGLGVAVSIAAQVGDLGESLLKRSLGVKDMSSLFPGHGGMLDRLDSLLFAAPVVYWVTRWLLD